jgi:hypothetical protein
VRPSRKSARGALLSPGTRRDQVAAQPQARPAAARPNLAAGRAGRHKLRPTLTRGASTLCTLRMPVMSVETPGVAESSARAVGKLLQSREPGRRGAHRRAPATCILALPANVGFASRLQPVSTTTVTIRSRRLLRGAARSLATPSSASNSTRARATSGARPAERPRASPSLDADPSRPQMQQQGLDIPPVENQTPQPLTRHATRYTTRMMPNDTILDRELSRDPARQ